MNIFVLDTNPAIAASMHCDQHLHKMILETAQMLSTAAHVRKFSEILPYLYVPAYQKHPCTIWAGESNHNMAWLISLAKALDSIRLDTGSQDTHSSMEVINIIDEYISHHFSFAAPHHVTHFVFAGPPTISIRPSLTIPQKYQLYYRRKYAEWLDNGRRMSYKNRSVPEFMADLIS